MVVGSGGGEWEWGVVVRSGGKVGVSERCGG